ncbi:hypothetical protein AB6A40_002059 [Gnathostoma spinigerum]|uniref:DNA endonuclease activator Ctp1 C-terminal domain-containing protein n=1 Tax=Gnathostoma spinigerum TaxID=75299 RepID=A0ABD6E5N0_9BILA
MTEENDDYNSSYDLFDLSNKENSVHLESHDSVFGDSQTEEWLDSRSLAGPCFKNSKRKSRTSNSASVGKFSSPTLDGWIKPLQKRCKNQSSTVSSIWFSSPVGTPHKNVFSNSSKSPLNVASDSSNLALLSRQTPPKSCSSCIKVDGDSLISHSRKLWKSRHAKDLPLPHYKTQHNIQQSRRCLRRKQSGLDLSSSLKLQSTKQPFSPERSRLSFTNGSPHGELLPTQPLHSPLCSDGTDVNKTVPLIFSQSSDPISPSKSKMETGRQNYSEILASFSPFSISPYSSRSSPAHAPTWSVVSPDKHSAIQLIPVTSPSLRSPKSKHVFLSENNSDCNSARSKYPMKAIKMHEEMKPNILLSRPLSEALRCPEISYSSPTTSPGKFRTEDSASQKHPLDFVECSKIISSNSSPSGQSAISNVSCNNLACLPITAKPSCSRMESPSTNCVEILNESAEKRIITSPVSLSPHSRKLAEVLFSPTFIRNYDRIPSQKCNIQQGEVVRKKQLRQKLLGYQCKCCSDYYDALGLQTPERKERINQVSRHRGLQANPQTPEHFWEVGMPNREEFNRRGMITETDSPLEIRSSKWKHEQLKRRLFVKS